MSRRSSKLLPTLLAVLALGVGVSAWFFLRTSPNESADFATAPELSLPDSVPGAELGALTPETNASDPNPKVKSTSAQDESARRQQASASELELREALWVEGRVVFPQDTPRGELVEVIALGRKFKTREMHRVKVESDGRFRVAFAPGTKTGRLDVDAMHLFLDKPQNINLSDASAIKNAVIEPFLGGALRGELKLAQRAAGLAPELVGKTVRASGWSGRWNDNVLRTATVGEDLRFVLRGLPPELGLTLEFDSNVVTKLSVPDVRAPAGETIERTFDLELGVRVRGRVRSSDGSLPKNTQLEVRVKGPKGGGMNAGRDTGKVADNGTFDLRGLTPGELTLTASAPQRVTFKLELGMLENGTDREGVELVLGMGNFVSGRVVWPDKSPAVEAQVIAMGGGSDNDPFTPFDTRFSVRTNANGEFQISGLNAGPYGLMVQGKAPVGEGQTRRRGQTWKARLEGVAADTTGLEIELVAGYSVEGLVVDDIGAPVTMFGVVATANDPGKRSFNIARMVSGMFKPDDGRFELGGLLEGGYTLRLNVPGHDDPKELDITVPNDGATYTFVAPRRALISGSVTRPDGSPAIRAEVEVVGSEGRWSDGGDDKADNNGRFEIKAAQTGKITITASLDGFAPSAPYEAELTGGESLTNLRLMLRTGGRITGEVLPSRPGERVDGRKVTASQGNGGDDSETTTDRGGKFEFKALAPGEYSVAGDAAATELDRLRDPSGRRGNDWELTELTKKRGRATVSDGGTAHVVLGAPPVAPVVVSGRVHRAGAGVAGLRVVAQGEGDRSWERRKVSRTDDAGRYELTVDEPGKYQIQVTPAGRGGTTLGSHVEVPAAGLGDVDFALASGRIAGKVMGPDGEDLGWVRLQIARTAGGDDKGSKWTGGSAQTDPEGQFEFGDLPAGDFSIEVSGSSWNRRTFEQRQYGKVKHQVALAEGQDKSDVVIRLEAAGTLKVSVLMADGSAAGSGRMSVRRTDGGSGLPDDRYFGNGEITREDLEPGVYEVRVEVSGQVSPEPERVNIIASETTTALVRLRPGGFVKFSAVDSQGQVVPATATVVDSAGRPLTSNRPLRNGETSGALPTGNCRVIARDSSGRTAEGSATISAGETAEVALTFQ